MTDCCPKLLSVLGIALSLVLLSQADTLLLADETAEGQGAPPPQSSLVDFPGFLNASQEAGEYRRGRLVSADRFLELTAEGGTLILDTRSKSAFDRRHLKGAVHLNFSDITDEKLAKVIPDKNTRILIYCNNNFRGDPANFPEKRLVLALNVPTFINLYASGYRNLYELSELVSVDDPRFEFAGTAVD